MITISGRLFIDYQMMTIGIAGPGDRVRTSRWRSAELSAAWSLSQALVQLMTPKMPISSARRKAILNGEYDDETRSRYPPS